MAGLSTGAGAPVVKVYHEKSMILPDVSRVLVCLYEKDVMFETVKDSYKDILRLQATRSVPVPFYDGPTFLQESRAICRYIAETYEQRGYPFLLGKDVLERASIEQWLRHEEHAFDPPSRALFCHLAFPLHDEGMDDIDREKRKLEEVLEVYEQRLGESEFLAGNKFTLADLVHLPNTHHIVTSEKFAYLYDSRKNVQRWWNTISARDSWQQVVRDMKRVEEQYQMEELEQQHQMEELEQHQQQEWQTEPLPTPGVRSIRIDPRKQAGTESRTILVPQPSDGIISSSFCTVPLPAETTSHGEPSPIQRKESTFFTAPEKTPSPLKPTLQEDSKTSDRISVPRQPSDVVAPDKPGPASAKVPHETESKPANVDPWVDNPVPYTKPDSQTPKSPYTAAQRAAATNGPEAGETSPDQRSVVQTPYAQQPSEQAKKASADQRAAAHLPENVAAKDGQDETAPKARHSDSKDITKEAREAAQKRATSAPTRELPSGSQNTPQQSKAPPTDLKVSDLLPLQAEYEDTQGAMNGDERFSTKRLRKMLEQSDAAALKSQSTDLPAPPKQEETPSFSKKPSHVQDRKEQAGNISADGKTDGTPSTGTRAPDTPTSADERRSTSPPKGRIAPDDRGSTEPRKSPSINEQQTAPPVPSQSPTTSARLASALSNEAAQDDDLAQLSTIDQWRHTSTPIQQGASGAPSIDKLDKTAGVDRRAQPSVPIKTSTEQSDKSATYERAPRMTPRQAPPSDTRHTSASTTPSQEPVSSSQQTTESIKEVTPTSHGITGDESANIAMADESATLPAPLQAPASDARSVSTALEGGILDAPGKNEAVKPSVVDPRGMSTTPKRPAATPDTQHRTTSDQALDQAPELPSFADTRNEKTGIADASQTTTNAPDEQPDGRAPKNTGAPAAGTLPMRSEENMNEAYGDGASIQQLSSDQSRTQPEENKKKQGGDATLVTEFGKSKGEGFLANTKQNNTGQAQATSSDGPSKKQLYSDQNKPISSKDTVQDIGSSEATREMLPAVSEKSMREQPLQGDKSSISPQDNGKQGSEAALPVSGTEQPKERELLTSADPNSGKTPGQALQSEEKTSPDTQKVKNNRSNSKSDGSSKPTQFDGDEGDVPESQRGGSSTNL